METTDKLIEKNPNSFVMKEIAGVSGLGAIAYSELHFQNVAEIIKQHVEGLILADKKWNDVLVFHSPGSYTEKNEIPVVHSPEPNTLHISCAQMASESKPFIEEIPGVENAEYLRLTAKFLKNSAESNPVTTLDEDVKSYKKAVTVSRNSNFFEFPIPTNPITTMGDLLPKSRLLMGEAIKHRQRTNYRTLSMQDSRRYFEGPGLIIFLAYADPELFGQTMVEIGSIDLGGRYIAKETVNALRETTFQEGVAKAVKASKTATKKKTQKQRQAQKKECQERHQEKTQKQRQAQDKERQERLQRDASTIFFIF